MGITLQTGDAAEAIHRLQAREAEVTIAALPDNLPPAIEFIVPRRRRWCSSARSGSPTPSSSATAASIGSARRWITAERGLRRERVDRWFREKGVQPNIYARVAGNEALLTMVSLGCGVGVAPRLVLEKHSADQVRVLDVRPQLASFVIGACTFTKNLDNPRIAAFWATVGREAALPRS